MIRNPSPTHGDAFRAPGTNVRLVPGFIAFKVQCASA